MHDNYFTVSEQTLTHIDLQDDKKWNIFGNTSSYLIKVPLPLRSNLPFTEFKKGKVSLQCSKQQTLQYNKLLVSMPEESCYGTKSVKISCLIDKGCQMYSRTRMDNTKPSSSIVAKYDEQIAPLLLQKCGGRLPFLL